MDILVVDDDRRIVKTTCDILRVKGHQATAAASGEEGIQRVAADRPDCVLMDIRMPGLGGLEALRQMHAIAPALPVILVSAYAADDLADEARRLGAYAILSKPVNLQAVLGFMELLSKVESILVVDDDAGFSRTLKDILTLRGYQVRTELDAAGVLDQLERERQLVVLLDLKLGATDGVEILQRIRDEQPAVPVIMITGYRQEMGDSIDKAIRLGALTCLYKPLEVEALLAVIEELRLKKLRSALEAPQPLPRRP